MTLTAGSRLDDSNFIDLKPGDKVTNGSGMDGTVLTNGYVETRDYMYSLFQLQGWRVTEIAETEHYSEPENLATFLQRARTVCIGAATDNGVTIQPVIDPLRAIGALDSPPLGPGMWLQIGDRDLRNRIDGKRGVAFGHGNPNHWSEYAEVNVRNERVTMGGVKHLARLQRVLSMEDPDVGGDVYLRPATEDDATRIAALRGRIWELGVRAKAEQRWCPAFETAVGTLAISPLSAVRVSAQGEPVTPALPDHGAAEDGLPLLPSRETGSAYPVGAIFEYSGGGYRPVERYTGGVDWNWTRRVEGFRFETQNMFGPNTGEYGGDRRVIFDGVGQMRIPIRLSLMEYLPVGTLIQDRNNTPGNGNGYTKVDDNRWRASSGVMVNARDFFMQEQITNDTPNPTWFITQIPPVHRGSLT